MGSLKEGEWSCYRGRLFNGERIVMSTEVASLKKRECYMLQRWCLMEREHGHVTVEARLMEGE